LPTGWYLRDEEITLDGDLANQILAGMTLPGSGTAATARKQNLPADHALRGRAELHLAAILGQLRPTLNLHRIAREWIYGDEPVTELGRAQRAWEQQGAAVAMA
jgi:hypothetical protein